MKHHTSLSSVTPSSYTVSIIFSPPSSSIVSSLLRYCNCKKRSVLLGGAGTVASAREVTKKKMHAPIRLWEVVVARRTLLSSYPSFWFGCNQLRSYSKVLAPLWLVRVSKAVFPRCDLWWSYVTVYICMWGFGWDQQCASRHTLFPVDRVSPTLHAQLACVSITRRGNVRTRRRLTPA